MADRGLSAGDITNLGLPNITTYSLLRIDFSTKLYYTNAPHDIDYDDGDGLKTYVSSANCPAFPAVKESLGIKPSTLALKFTGSAANHALTLTEDYKNVPVKLYRDIGGASPANAITIFDGFMDSYDTFEDSEKGTSEVIWNCVSHWANWEAQSGRYINSVSQARIGYSGDKFFEFAGVTDVILDYWGGLDGFGGKSANDEWWFRLTNDTLNDNQTPQWYLDIFDYKTLSGNYYNWEKSRSTTLKLPVAYGVVATQGVPVFRALSGTNDKYLWVVYALSEGECEGLTGDKIRFDGKAYDHADFNSTITHVFYSGKDTQSTTDAGVGDGVINASSLIAASADWTTSHDGNGIAYCIIRYEFDKAVWNKVPEPVFLMNGKKLIDPNNTGNPKAFSQNPAWISYDYISNSRYGKGIPVAKLADFDSGATYAATLVTDHSGGSPTSIPLFEFNGAIDTNNTIKKNAEAILFSMRGYLAWVGGLYTLVIENHVSPTSVYSFDEDNISGTFKVSEKGIKSLLNLVEYEFVDSLLNYSADVVYADSATFLSEDNGRELRKKFVNKFEINRYRAQNRANTILKQSREIIGTSFSAANADALKIECGKIIDITRAIQGWVNKKFRVRAVTIKPNGDIVIDEADEYEPASFDWSVSTEVILPADTALLDPFTSVAPTGVTLSTGTVRTASDGTTFHRLKITWTASVSKYISYYEVQVKEDNDGVTEWVPLPNVDADGDLFTHYEPVPVGISFDARVRSVNTLGKPSGWATDNNYEVTGTRILGTDADLLSTDNINATLYYFHTFFESLDNYTNDTDVTKGADDNGFKMVTTGSSFVYKWLYNDINQLMDWSKKRTCRTAFKITMTGTAGTLYVGMGFGSSYSVAKFVWNNTTSEFDVYVEQSKGTIINTGALFDASFASGEITEIEIYTDPSLYKSDLTINKTVSLWVAGFSTFPVSSYNTPMYFYAFGVTGGTMTVEVDEFLFLQEK